MTCVEGGWGKNYDVCMYRQEVGNLYSEVW